MKARRRWYDRIMEEKHGYTFCTHPEDAMEDVTEREDLGFAYHWLRRCTLCGVERHRYLGKVRQSGGAV